MPLDWNGEPVINVFYRRWTHQLTVVTLTTLSSRSSTCTDLSGRIAFSVFCKSALDLDDSEVLQGSTDCLTSSHPLLDAINVLNRVSSR